MEPARRIVLAREPNFAIGAAQVSPSAHEVSWPEGRERLEPRVMQVLIALAQAGGEAVSRDDLIETCWEGRFVGDDSLHRCILRLRKLAEATGGAFTIETLPKTGYRLLARNRSVSADAPASAAAKRKLPSWLFPVAVTLLIATVTGAVFWPKPPAAGLRVAVLPFEASGDPVARAVAGGIPDQMIALLTERQAPTVSREAAGRADRGGARLLATGAVDRSGDNLRVRVRLDDAKAGLTLWSATIERPAVEAADLPDQTAALTVDIIDRAQRAFDPQAGNVDSSILGAYLRVLQGNRGAREQAVALLDIERELTIRAPRFSGGHSSLAAELAAAAPFQPPQIAAQWRAESRAAAKKALALDPHNGEAYFALYLLEPEGAWARREAWLLEGLRQDPRNATLLTQEAGLLRASGRPRAALPMVRQAQQIDPLSPNKTAETINALGALGLSDEADRLGQRALRRWPANQHLRWSVVDVAYLYLPAERALQALDVHQRGEPRMPPRLEAAWRRYVTERSGASARALAAVGETNWNSSAYVVGALSQAGEVDAAFALIGHLLEVDPGRSRIPTLFDPANASLRRDPRFMLVADRLGLVDYWRTSGHWPEFCAEPGQPYDCRVEAARAKASRMKAP